MTAQAVPTLANGTGCITGLLAPAALITRYGPTSFRTYWYICSAMLALSTLICYFCYNPPARELQQTLTIREKINRLDWIGGGLITLGLISLCIALFWAQNPYPWASAQVLVPLCVSIVVLATFGLYETKYKKDGMLNHRIFSRDWNVAIALAGMAFEGLIYIPKPILMGANFSIGFITYIIVGWCAAWYSYRRKGVRMIVIVGFTSFLIFNICMATATLKSRTSMWGYAIFFGIGLPCVLNGQVSLAQFSAPPELIATTSGLLATFRGVGTCVGAAIYTALYNAKTTNNLPREIAKSVANFDLPVTSLRSLILDLPSGNTHSLAKIPGITPEVIAAATHGLQIAYLKSFRYLWITSAACAAGGMLIALFLKDVTSDFNQKIDAPAESEEALYGDRIKQAVLQA
ncbi:hypothetical protein B0A52_06751 [Exophiala mesophila]|uniref:Major facilitator superfamily (MFS) profile domain-containing protein n=1 Tax=Exophiala mesophila TaxID=212818 RepID=A0A438N008_EXOME|nr:hypothetical protein B0A52_06751 [Exophiala mesophila]